MKTLTINTGDPALEDEVALAAIDDITIGDYRDPEKKAEALEHLKEATSLFVSSMEIFKTVDDHYEEMRALGVDEKLPPVPTFPIAEGLENLVSQEARGLLTFFTTTDQKTMWNWHLYGVLVHMADSYNEMVKAYNQKYTRMQEMSGRIEGDRDRYTVLYSDLISLRGHIVSVAKTLEYYYQHFPEDSLRGFHESKRESFNAELLGTEKRLLKHFQIFMEDDVSDDVKEEIEPTEEKVAASMEEKKQEEQKRKEQEEKEEKEIKLISFQAYQSLKTLLPQIIATSTLGERLQKKAEAIRDYFVSIGGEFYGQEDIITAEDDVPVPISVLTLKILRKVLVKARALPDIGLDIDLNIQRIEETLPQPSVTAEEAALKIREGIGRVVERLTRELEQAEEMERERRKELEDNKARIRELEKGDATDDEKAERENLRVRVRNIEKHLTATQRKREVVKKLKSPKARDDLAADIISLAVGGRAGRVLSKALASGSPAVILAAGAVVGLLYFSGGRRRAYIGDKGSRREKNITRRKRKDRPLSK